LKVVEVSPEIVRQTLCGEKQATKDELVQVIRRFDRDFGDYLAQANGQLNCQKRRRLIESAALGVYFYKIKNQKHV
jgi:hypothetical protein